MAEQRLSRRLDQNDIQTQSSQEKKGRRPLLANGKKSLAALGAIASLAVPGTAAIIAAETTASEQVAHAALVAKKKKRLELGIMDQGAMYRGENAVVADLGKRMGAKWTRITVDMKRANAGLAPRHYNFDVYKNAINTYNSRGYKVQLTIGDMEFPRWAGTRSRPDKKDVLNFVTQTMKAVGKKADAVSILNEPDWTHRNKKTGKKEQVNPCAYRSIFVEGRKIVRKINPGTPVWFGEGFNRDYFRKALNCSPKPVIAEGFAGHFYQLTSLPKENPHGMNIGNLDNVKRMLQTEWKPRLHTAANKAVPIKATELGAPTPADKKRPHSESWGKRWWQQAIPILRRNADVVIAYEVIQPPVRESWDTSLTRRQGNKHTPRPAFRVLQQNFKK